MTTLTEQQIGVDSELTPEIVRAAYDAIEQYDLETFDGGEPHFPDWAPPMIKRAVLEGFLGKWIKEGLL